MNDELLKKAIDLACASGKITLPLLQTELSLSYDKARQILCELERLEVVAYVGGVDYAVTAGYAKQQIGEGELAPHHRKLRERKSASEAKNQSSSYPQSSDDSDDNSYDDDDDLLCVDDIEDMNVLEEMFNRLYGDRQQESSSDVNPETSPAGRELKVKPIPPSGELPRRGRPDAYDMSDGYVGNGRIRLPAAGAAYERRERCEYLAYVAERSRQFADGELVWLDECLKNCLLRISNIGQKVSGVQYESKLRLANGAEFMPYLNANENDLFAFWHPLFIDKKELKKLKRSRKFFFILKRHGAIYDGTDVLYKTFYGSAEATRAAADLYAALCEAQLAAYKN